MKKIFCFTLLFSSFFAISQIREKGTIELSPIIGYSQSNYLTHQILGEPISELHLGVNGDYFFNNRWSIRSGIFFQKMGSGGGIFWNYKENLNYVTIPVNANWHFGSTRKWNLNFGTSLGVLTSAKTNVPNSPSDIKDLVKPLQISLSMGIGYKIQISEKLSILLDHQESIGLMEVNKNGGDKDIVNTFSSFNVGLVFKL